MTSNYHQQKLTSSQTIIIPIWISNANVLRIIVIEISILLINRLMQINTNDHNNQNLIMTKNKINNYILKTDGGFLTYYVNYICISHKEGIIHWTLIKYLSNDKTTLYVSYQGMPSSSKHIYIIIDFTFHTPIARINHSQFAS